LAGALAAAGVAWATRVNFGRDPVAARAPAFVLLFLGAAFLGVLPGLAALAVLAPAAKFGVTGRISLVLGATGVSGLIVFWAYVVSPGAGRATGAAVLIGSAVVLGIRGNPSWLDAELFSAMGLGMLIGLGYAGLAFLRGGLTDGATHAIAVRYWVAPDNKIPLLFAERLLRGGSLRVPLLPGWHSSDRPPLQTGLALMQLPLMGNHELGYQMASTGLQAAWVPALWAILRSVRLRRTVIVIGIVTVALTGATFVNTVYVWPKLLSAALLLCAAATLLEVRRAAMPPIAVVLVALLISLGLLAHGSGAFFVIGLLPLIAILAWRHRGRYLIAAGGVAIVAYLPWMFYQRYIDPPGDRLLKWELAGVIPLDNRSILRALLDQYRRAGTSGVVSHKVSNLMSLIARPGQWRTEPADPGWHYWPLGFARVGQVNNLLIAMGPLTIGFAALLYLSWRGRLPEVRPLLTILGLSVVAWILILFGGTDSNAILAEGSYAVVLLVLALAVIGALALPRSLGLLILISNAIWFAECWIPGIGFRPAGLGLQNGHLDVAAMTALLCGALGAACLV
jgi:hypothetical protein